MQLISFRIWFLAIYIKLIFFISNFMNASILSLKIIYQRLGLKGKTSLSYEQLKKSFHLKYLTIEVHQKA